MSDSYCQVNPVGVAFIARTNKPASSTHGSVFGLCLGRSRAWLQWLFFLVLLAGPAHAVAHNALLFTINGLAGVRATVAVLEDETGEAGLPEVSQRTDFQLLSEKQFKPTSLNPFWLRLDIEVPQALLGQVAWMVVKPANIYDLRFYQGQAAEQRSGIGQPFSGRSTLTRESTFAVDLAQPITRVYLRVYGAVFNPVLIELQSAEALQKHQQTQEQLNAFFFGAMFLMLLVNLVNWVWTRELLYRSYAGFLASVTAFFLLANNYVSAYLLQEQAFLSLLLLKFCASWVVAGMVFFSLQILKVDQHQPRLARALRGLGWLLLISNLLVFYLPWVPLLIQFNVVSYLLMGLMFLAISARQAWQLRSTHATLLFVTYLLFTIFDKVQLLSQLGLVPVSHWGLDARKLAYLILLLPMHALLVAQLRQQRKEKSASERLAAAARQEAWSAQKQGAELARFMALLSESYKTVVHASNEPQMLSKVCELIGQVGQFQRAWVHLTTLVIHNRFTQVEHDVASMPLVYQSQVFGVLEVRAASGRGFSAAEVNLLEEVARNLAFGLQNLRVQDELAKHQMRLEELVQERTQQIEILNDDLTRKKEEADEANRAKDDFIANLSHELRTPLNAVLGLTRLLEASPVNPRQRDYLEKIQLSGKLLQTLIDDILDFSKIRAQALKLDPVPFSLGELLTNVASVLGVGIGRKPIEPLLDIAPDVPDELIGDGLRLQQILLNFISNAVKFTQQGEIALTVQRLPPLGLADVDGVRLQFNVRDTGIGMSDETRKIIFNSFTQADASTSRIYGGTGLGLAISEQLATLMGGHLTVSSTPGQGSEFSFTVTLKSEARAARPLLPLHPLRLLVAEDNALNQEVIEHILTQAGAQVVLASHGQAAVAALQVNGARFDAVLMDIQMPLMDGYAATHQIREVLGLVDLPIIAMTAHARPQDREKSRLAGMVGHLVMPFHAQDLLDILVCPAGQRVSSDFQVQ